MKTLIFIIYLLTSLQVLANDNKSTLEQLFDQCLNGTLNDCEQILIGDENKKKMILFAVQSKNVTKNFKKVHYEAYGKEEYNKFNEVFEFSTSLMDLSKFKLTNETNKRKLYTGPDSFTTVCVFLNGKWHLDLNQSNFINFVAGSKAESDTFYFFQWVIGAQKALIKSINKNSSAKQTFLDAGLYSMAIFYDSAPPEQQKQFQVDFAENHTSLANLRQFLINSANE